MKWISVFVVCLLVMLQGCQSAYPTINHNGSVVSINEIQTYIFSNEQSISLEEDYYDALLQFKNKFPKQKYTVKIIDANEYKDLIKIHDVSTFPTLIMMNNKLEVIRIEGKQTKESIFAKLQNTFEE